MKDKFLKVNLQLFAEGEPTETEPKTKVETEPATEPETKVDEIVEEEKTVDNVPLSKFLEEKKRRKEYERKLREFEGKEDDRAKQDAISKIKKMAKDKNFDDDTTELFEEMFKEVLSLQPKKDTLSEQIKEDVEDFVEIDPNIRNYEKQIKSTIEKFRKIGEEISVEDAYRFVNPNFMTKEMQVDLEQKQALKRRESEASKTLNSTSSSTKTPYPLDEDDKKALEGLKKAQPDSGWTEEKYYKLMKG